jgi:hypothetical protein
MQLDAILEVTIGLVVTWLIISMAASQIQEAIIETLGWRSKFLEDRLLEMFKDPALVEKFYNHPLIATLSVKTFWGKTRNPTDIPNPIFAKAAVDIFLNAGKPEIELPANSMSLDKMRQNTKESIAHLKQAKNEDLANALKYLVPNLDGAATEFEKKLVEYRGNVESWFDTTMVQATKLYRKYASAIALGLGIGLAVVFNVDSVDIVNQLWRDPTLRQTIVAQAENISPDDSASIADTKARLDALSLPVGWNQEKIPASPMQWAVKGLGVFLTGLAASLGSPFWFDILNRLLGLKSGQKSKQAEAAKG